MYTMSKTNVSTKYSEYPSLRLYDHLGVDYIVAPNIARGPLWVGFAMLLDSADEYGDAGYFHELAHWLVATSAQRRKPDFGLGQQPNASSTHIFTASTMTGVAGHRAFGFKPLKGRGWGEDCVSVHTAERQERLACIALGVYEPLTGICGWDDRLDADSINTALYDFGGVDAGRIALADIKSIHTKVVAPTCETVGVPTPSLDTVRDYMRHVWATVQRAHR